MRYLKLYEHFDINTFKEKVEQGLVYLTDLGFDVNVSNDFTELEILIGKNNGRNSLNFTWEQIEDILIPYLTDLSDDYNFKLQFNNWDNHYLKEITDNDLFTDENKVGYQLQDVLIQSLVICLKRKKKSISNLQKIKRFFKKN
jgi:hypothetical protein